MRRLKSLLLGILFLACLGRYFPVFYYASQYNDFVKQAPQRTGVGSQLQQALLSQAALYFLPVKPDDIQIKQEAGVIRVKVDYKVPVDFFIFKHEISFSASGAGLMAKLD